MDDLREDNNRPFFTSDNWRTLSKNFESYGKISEAAAIAFGAQALRSRDLKTRGAATAAGLAASATAFVAKQAAEYASQQANIAAQQEAKRKAEVEAAAREAAAQRERQAKFEKELNKETHDLRDRIRSGEFMRSYRDPPTRERIDSIGRIA